MSKKIPNDFMMIEIRCSNCGKFLYENKETNEIICLKCGLTNKEDPNDSKTRNN